MVRSLSRVAAAGHPFVLTGVASRSSDSPALASHSQCCIARDIALSGGQSTVRWAA